MYDFFLDENNVTKHVTVYEYHDVLKNECNLKDYSLIYDDNYAKNYKWYNAYKKVKENVSGMYYDPKSKQLITKNIWILSSNKSDDELLYFAIHFDKAFAYVNHELVEVTGEC